MSFDFYRNRVLMKGNTSQDRIINEKKKSFDEYLKVAPSVYNIIIDGNSYQASVQDRMFNDEILEDKYLLTHIETPVRIGSYVEWDNELWIIKSMENESVKSHQSSKMAKCNNTLTFQDSSTLEIYKLPCMLQDKTSVYSDGINEGKLIVLADDQIMITVPNNDITKKISTGKRFIFNSDIENIYESTKVDRLLNNGLTSIIMKHAIYNPTEDNLELNIADYIQPPGQPDEPEIPDEPNNPTDYTITINGYDTVIFGTWEQYAVSVLQDGVEVDKPVKFELIGDESLAWIDDIEGNLCKVYANKDRVRGTVILRVSLIEDENVYAEKKITTVAW